MKSIAIQPWGNYAIALASSVECLNVKPWTQRSSTPEMLRLGVEASPEFACISFKASTGHFIKAAMEGVEYGVMVNSVGTCRLRYYHELQQKILKERGLDLHVFNLGYDGFKPPMVRYFDPKIKDVLTTSARSRLKVLAVDALELEAWKTRARERNRGETTRMLNQCLDELGAAGTVPEIRRLMRNFRVRFTKIPRREGFAPLKVGLLGEATVLRDRYLNHNVEEILGGLGVEVRNFFLMGEEIRKIFHIGFFSPHSRRILKKLAKPYLKSLVGGHAMESVAYTIRCAREGYDGVVHIAPSGCMPEISVRPILRKISRDLDFPVLECSFDEHSSHVGVVTRLEAFVDVLRDRKRRKKI